MNMTLLRGESFKDTLMLRIGGDVSSQSVQLSIINHLITERGQDISLNLEFDVSRWLDGVDVINETPLELTEKLYGKLTDVIKLRN
jgi:hypothetical protein